MNDQEAMAANTETSVTDDKIEALIHSEHFFTAADGRIGAIANDHYAGRERPLPNNKDLEPLGLLIFCVLILKNGYTIVGKSACADPANFDADKGCYWARKDAVKQIWPLEGYLLRQRLHDAKTYHNGLPIKP